MGKLIYPILYQHYVLSSWLADATLFLIIETARHGRYMLSFSPSYIHLYGLIMFGQR